MKKIPEKYNGQWVLVDKQNNVLFSSKHAGDVVNEGYKYPLDEVSIVKKNKEGTEFYSCLLRSYASQVFLFKPLLILAQKSLHLL